MNNVCIIIVSYNSSLFLKLTNDSLISAKSKTAFEIVIIDNGSKPESLQFCKSEVERLKGAGLRVTFFDTGKNLGFSGGNNVGIEHFLSKPEFTHTCLLNSDVIVSDYWLDRLLDFSLDAVGPVTSCAGNEQTVPIPYEASLGERCFRDVNQFAEIRYQLLKGAKAEAEVLVFYCVLFSRRLVEKVGLLDTRFFPGCYEDDDYCARITQAGFKMYVARDTFIHHYGGASFAQLPYTRMLDFQKNRKRFEEKQNVKWQNRSGKVALSLQEDLESFPAYEQFTPDQKKIIRMHTRHLEFEMLTYSNTIERHNSMTFKQLLNAWAGKRVEAMRHTVPRILFVTLKFVIVYLLAEPGDRKLLGGKIKKKVLPKISS